MRNWIVVAAALINTPSAQAADTDLCKALLDLKAELSRSSEPQRVAFIKVEPMTVACRRAEAVVAQNKFCDAVLDAIGIEFTHRFPWAIYDCLRRQSAGPSIEVTDQYTGLQNRKKIKHLWAAWHDEIRIDVRFEPLGDLSNDAAFKDYWGEYQLTIWRP